MMSLAMGDLLRGHSVHPTSSSPLTIVKRRSGARARSVVVRLAPRAAALLERLRGPGPAPLAYHLCEPARPLLEARLAALAAHEVRDLADLDAQGLVFRPPPAELALHGEQHAAVDDRERQVLDGFPDDKALVGDDGLDPPHFLVELGLEPAVKQGGERQHAVQARDVADPDLGERAEPLGDRLDFAWPRLHLEEHHVLAEGLGRKLGGKPLESPLGCQRLELGGRRGRGDAREFGKLAQRAPRILLDRAQDRQVRSVELHSVSPAGKRPLICKEHPSNPSNVERPRAGGASAPAAGGRQWELGGPAARAATGFLRPRAPPEGPMARKGLEHEEAWDPEEYKEFTRETWDYASPAYVAFATRYLEPYGRELLKMLKVPRHGRLLDLACGGGEPGITLAKRMGPLIEVVGCDLSPKMVEVARREARRKGASNISFRVADAEDLPFPRGAFDMVTCRFGLQIFSTPEKALREMRRVLKPGGQLGVAVWGLPWRAEFLDLIIGAIVRNTAQPEYI